MEKRSYPEQRLSQQDADRLRTLTAGSEFPPFSTCDLYGTVDGRLLHTWRLLDNYAQAFSGCLGVIAKQLARDRDHYSQLVLMQARRSADSQAQDGEHWFGVVQTAIPSEPEVA